MRPERLNWPGRLAGISEGGSRILKEKVLNNFLPSFYFKNVGFKVLYMSFDKFLLAVESGEETCQRTCRLHSRRPKTKILVYIFYDLYVVCLQTLFDLQK